MRSYYLLHILKLFMIKKQIIDHRIHIVGLFQEKTCQRGRNAMS